MPTRSARCGSARRPRASPSGPRKRPRITTTSRTRQWLAAPWLPPAADELAAQRAAFDAVAVPTFELEAIWFVKVETGVDGVAWLELERRAEAPTTRGRRRPTTTGDDVEAEVVGRDRRRAEVLYSRAAMRRPTTDAPAEAGRAPTSDDDDDDDDDDDADRASRSIAAREPLAQRRPAVRALGVVSDRALPRDHRRLRLGELRHRDQARRAPRCPARSR